MNTLTTTEALAVLDLLEHLRFQFYDGMSDRVFINEPTVVLTADQSHTLQSLRQRLSHHLR